MKVLFASGDVGGARALLPVIETCEKNTLPFVVLDHGHIGSEAPKRWQRIVLDRDWVRTADDLIFTRNRIEVLAFSSSVKDAIALTLARRAKKIGIPTIHVLDSWTGYRRRMEVDGLSAFTPDVYTVMDDLAFEGAVRDGIDESTLVVTGHPSFASLYKEYTFQKKQNPRKERKRFGFDPNKMLILFVSEPVELDQGASPESPQYRGYTEKIVLRLLYKALEPYADKIEIGLLPHPRENAEDLLKIWNECHGSLDGGLLRVGKGRESVFLADCVAGMSSILLYEAWVLGKPVISLQPGLQLEPLRMLEKRECIVFVDSYESAIASITAWFSAIRPECEAKPRPELRMFEEAPKNVFRLIEKCLEQASFNAISHQRRIL